MSVTAIFSFSEYYNIGKMNIFISTLSYVDAVSLCVLDARVSCAKTAETIEMLFEDRLM